MFGFPQTMEFNKRIPFKANRYYHTEWMMPDELKNSKKARNEKQPNKKFQLAELGL